MEAGIAAEQRRRGQGHPRVPHRHPRHTSTRRAEPGVRDDLTDAGFDADAQVVRGLTHEEVNAAVGQAGETTVTKPLMDFFRDCALTAQRLKFR